MCGGGVVAGGVGWLMVPVPSSLVAPGLLASHASGHGFRGTMPTSLVWHDPAGLACHGILPATCWLGWGRSPLTIVLCCLGWFLAAKSAASQHGVCASSYYFHSDYFSTVTKLGLCPESATQYPARMDACRVGDFSVPTVESALGVHPSAASNQPRVAKQTTPATAPISNQ